MDNVAGRIEFTFPQGSLAPWARLLERAGRGILGLVAWHAQMRSKRATLHELESLSPRALADIGLTRADVDLMGAARAGEWAHHRFRALYL